MHYTLQRVKKDYGTHTLLICVTNNCCANASCSSCKAYASAFRISCIACSRQNAISCLGGSICRNGHGL